METAGFGTVWRVPLRGRSLLLVAAALLIAGAAYCMGHALLSGSTNQWGRAFAWSAGAVLPWLLLIELVKRVEQSRSRPLAWPVLAGALMLTALISLGIEEAVDRGIWGAASAPLPLQLLRRLPPLALVGALIWARRVEERRRSAGVSIRASLDPQRLRYASAADNYVELHHADRSELIRGTLAAVAEALAPHGFVRVHRSIVVHPRHVVGVEHGGRTPVLKLDRGERLPTGERYRASLHHFVP